MCFNKDSLNRASQKLDFFVCNVGFLFETRKQTCVYFKYLIPTESRVFKGSRESQIIK